MMMRHNVIQNVMTMMISLTMICSCLSIGVLRPHRSNQCSPINANPSAPARNDVTRSPHDELVGKEVILYAVLRSEIPVAKGTIISTNPTTLVGGQPLGKQYCEVIVSLVLKRDATLRRPHAEMNTKGDSHMMAIAWPYKKVKVSKASKSSLVLEAVLEEMLGRMLEAVCKLEEKCSCNLLSLFCFGVPGDEYFAQA